MVGEKNVVQMVTDNAANYKLAGSYLCKRYTSITWSPCAAHCLNLVLKDVSELDKVKSLVTLASRVTVFIYNHKWPLKWLRKRDGWTEIIRPGATRFGTAFIVLKSLYDHKSDLQAMVISNEFKKMLKVGNAMECKEIVFNETFWKNCLITVKVMTPLLRLLRLCDSDEKPALGYVYEGMHRARKGVKDLFKKKKELYKPYTDIIDRRWDRMLRTSIHCVAYWLNPAFQYDHDNLCYKREVFQGVLDMVEKNFRGSNVIDLTMALGKFRDSEGTFGRPSAVASRTITRPDDWWKLFGGDTPVLQKFAIRILSQTASTSVKERRERFYERRTWKDYYPESAIRFVLNNLTVPSGKNDTRTFLDYIAIDQVRLPVNGDWLSEGLVEPFAEPERELKKKNKKKSKAGKARPRASNFDMGDEAPMWNTRRTAPTVPTRPITKPNLETEIKGQFLHMIKELTFDGKGDSNPITHIDSFEEICDLFKTEANQDAIRLRLFSLTLVGDAKAWLRSLEPSSIDTWNDLRSKFLSRFFPPSNIEKLWADIRSFRQDDDETISEAWERFKHLLNWCPSHGLNKSEQVQTFYSGLNYSSRGTLDSSAGGVFMYKTPTQGYNLLEDMLIHNIDWKSDKRLHIPKLAGKISTEFDPSDELAAMKNKQVGCEECHGLHLTKDCPNKPMMTPEEVNYINRGDYQGRWNNNRNFNQRPPGFFSPNQRTDGEQRASLEDRLFQFMETQKKINEEVGSYLRNQQSVIQNLELQVGRISQTLSGRTQGELPTQTQVNPKVEASKTMLMVGEVTTKKAWTDIYTRKYIPSDSEPDYATDYESDGISLSFEHLGLRGPIELSDKEDEEEDSKQGGYAEFIIPKQSKGKEEAKEEDDELIYVAPIKHDPGSYSLPISVSNRFEGFALVDMGAALNMMHVSYCSRMKIKKLTPTTYQYRGINGYMTRPLGIVEVVPIRIGKFVYLTDFIVADLPKDTEILIILGRAFLHTVQANVDMCNQVTTLGYGDKRITFNPDGKPVTHLLSSYVDPSQCFKENSNRRYFHMST
ncbi:hypothetical protein OSB04_019182 [Centaurea solstitialis]|uniref:Retrotransposon gag domain-containing protein n=1 Tax=Centaurea solstitialis TaxID=347529 RepID=A0AA38SRG2_9ASTR|nr:hypothetical protein OSB04_019182 [Centaurea solstitialis]